jgi:hypothetical protein
MEMHNRPLYSIIPNARRNSFPLSWMSASSCDPWDLKSCLRIGGIADNEADHRDDNNGTGDPRRLISRPHGRGATLAEDFFDQNHCLCNISKTATPSSQGEVRSAA